MAEIADVVENTEKALIDGLSDLGKDSEAFKSAEQAIKDKATLQKDGEGPKKDGNDNGNDDNNFDNNNNDRDQV